MNRIKSLLLLASAVASGAWAQSSGLTDMSRSKYACMANTELDAVQWTDGFLGRTFQGVQRNKLAKHVEHMEYTRSQSRFP